LRLIVIPVSFLSLLRTSLRAILNIFQPTIFV
jgi:hypothetical protein